MPGGQISPALVTTQFDAQVTPFAVTMHVGLLPQTRPALVSMQPEPVDEDEPVVVVVVDDDVRADAVDELVEVAVAFVVADELTLVVDLAASGPTGLEDVALDVEILDVDDEPDVGVTDVAGGPIGPGALVCVVLATPAALVTVAVVLIAATVSAPAGAGWSIRDTAAPAANAVSATAAMYKHLRTFNPLIRALSGATLRRHPDGSVESPSQPRD